MTIELKPDQERIIEAAMTAGRFRSIEEAIDQALQSITAPTGAPKLGTRQPGKPSLVELFAQSPLKGLDLVVERSKDEGRPLDL
jgi:hypothetical protein